MSATMFFRSSRQAAENITDIFDFVWPTAAAMWNLRWQVDGFLRAEPTVSNDALAGRFIEGSGIRGANLKTACIDISWQQQQERFAKFLLIEICALYEGFLEGIIDEIALVRFDASGFQLPSTSNAGFHPTLARARTAISIEMSNCIFPALARNRKYSLQKVDELLKCYKFFKECRNSLIHRGSIVDDKVMKAYKMYHPLAKNALGVAEKPAYTPINAIGEKIVLQLRGVVGLADVVLRIIATLDAELCKCQEAEDVLASMWIEKHRGAVTLPSDPVKKNRRATRLVVQLNLPTPLHPDQLIAMLKRRGLAN
jgi:hypothetical protein